jgi:RimJ/RimL family protein N-acetyltransferase
MKPEPEPIHTQRLTLIPLTPEHVRTFFEDKGRLAAMLGVTIPDSWPVFPEGIIYWKDHPELLSDISDWASRLFVHSADRVLIGDGGFKGVPDADGRVEIGYALVSPYRGQGLGTEAARALVDWAFSHPEISAVCAETLRDAYQSMRLLEKLGMTFDSLRQDDVDEIVYRWQVSREVYLTPKNPIFDDV